MAVRGTFERCKAVGSGNRSLGCNFAAIAGSRFCLQHQRKLTDYGDGPKTVFGAKFTTDAVNKGLNASKEQMGFFRKRMGPKLTEYLEDALAVKEFDISEEVALTRTACEATVAIYSGLLEAEELIPEGNEEARKAWQLAVREAANAVKSAMNDITHQVERQAKIHSMVAEKIHPNAIQDVVRQINRMVYETFGHDHWDLVQRFDKKLSEELQLPSLKNAGTTITPDQEVQLMDASVPLYVEEEQPNEST